MYQVSNIGRVRAKDKYIHQQGRIQLYKGCIMSPYLSTNGYYMVTLSKNNKKKRVTIHRLVASAFLPNPLHLQQVNHINENKLDNVVSNLEWCSREYNVNYGTATHRRAVKMGSKVGQYNTAGLLVNAFFSIHEANRKTGISRSSISKCIKGKGITAGGYFWYYDDSAAFPSFYKPDLAKNCAHCICQYDKNLNFIATYKSGHEAAKITGFNHENICACCRGKAISCGGFIWKYEGEIPTVPLEKIQRSNQKEVIQYNLEDVELNRFPSIASASKSLGGGKSAGIKQCIYGKNKTAYGYKWKYAH